MSQVVLLPQSNFGTAANPKDVNRAKSSKRRGRGRTKMTKVHTRRFEDRKLIPLNELCQPIFDDGKLISEFSHILGTVAREFVPLTYVSWHKVPDKEHLWTFVKVKYIIAEEGKLWVLRRMKDA